jgi:hypothetical protein
MCVWGRGGMGRGASVQLFEKIAEVTLTANFKTAIADFNRICDSRVAELQVTPLPPSIE